MFHVMSVSLKMRNQTLCPVEEKIKHTTFYFYFKTPAVWLPNGSLLTL